MKNIAPAIFPPNGIGDTKPTNQAVLDWVHEIGKLTKPENIFWCDGSERENEFLIAESLKQNVLIKLNEKKVPRSYLHRSNPNDVARVEQGHFHLHADQRRSRAHKQLVGTGGNIFETIWTAERRDARAHHVCRALHHGPARFAADESWVRNHRFKIRRAQHANHDAHGRDRAEPAWQRSEGGMESRRAFACWMSIRSGGSSGIFRRTTRLSRSAPVMAATFCWAKNVWRCASARISRVSRAGWRSTC